MINFEDAIRDEHAIQFVYDKGDGPMLRTFSPWEINEYEYNTIVLGWDHDREAIRGFDTAKIDPQSLRWYRYADYVPPSAG